MFADEPSEGNPGIKQKILIQPGKNIVIICVVPYSASEKEWGASSGWNEVQVVGKDNIKCMHAENLWSPAC